MIDSVFTSGGATDLALQPDGRIVVVGSQQLLRRRRACALHGRAGPWIRSFNDDGRFTLSFRAVRGRARTRRPDRRRRAPSGATSSSARFLANGGDVIAPVLTLPAAIVAEATSQAGAAVTYTATAHRQRGLDSHGRLHAGVREHLRARPDDGLVHRDRRRRQLPPTAASSFAIVDTVAPTIVAGAIRVNADSPAGARRQLPRQGHRHGRPVAGARLPAAARPLPGRRHDRHVHRNRRERQPEPPLVQRHRRRPPRTGRRPRRRDRRAAAERSGRRAPRQRPAVLRERLRPRRLGLEQHAQDERRGADRAAPDPPVRAVPEGPAGRGRDGLRVDPPRR